MIRPSHDGVQTIVSSFARFAVFSHPHVIKLVHGLFDDYRVVCQDACFKVALVISLHANASTSEVGTADINLLTIENHHFEMDSWTKDPFKTVVEYWIFVKILPEIWSRFFCMDKPHLHTTPNELGHKSQKWFRLLPQLHIKVFYIGSTNPKRMFHRLNP